MIYDAKITKLKKSKNKPGYYYPVFEYQTKNEIKTYTRKKPMEMDPFYRKTYHIIDSKSWGVQELTEIHIHPLVLMTLFRILTIVLMFIDAKFIPFSVVSGVLSFVLFYFREALKANVLKDRIGSSKIVVGEIVGFQEKWVNNANGLVDSVFYPIIEYKYKNKIYYHVSAVEMPNEKRLGRKCNIYVDFKRRGVFDSFESRVTVKTKIDKTMKPVKQMLGLPVPKAA